MIFGIRTSECSPILMEYSCPCCAKDNTIYILPYQIYFHIFWVPTFPMGKDYTVYCNSCGKEFLPAYFPMTSRVRGQLETPKWTFLGLLIAAGFFILTVLFGLYIIVYDITTPRKDSTVYKETPIEIKDAAIYEELSSQIENANIGDIYEIKIMTHDLKHRGYTLCKVDYTTEDSIYFYTHPYGVISAKEIPDLKLANFRQHERYKKEYSKLELKGWVYDKRILKIYTPQE